MAAIARLLPEPRWRGLRLVATDSTTLRLPNWLENHEDFGVQWDRDGQSYVLARALGLFSTASRLMIKSVVARYEDAERALLVRLLPHLTHQDLLIMDRGFPAVWLFVLLQQRDLPFLARMDGTNWPEVKAFLRSGLSERLSSRPISAHARRQAKKLGLTLSAQTLSIRLIRVVLPNGRIEILTTSLLDTHAFPAAEFSSLYHARWNIEEAFKTLKHRLFVEQFTGELPEAIRQDFHAKVFTANLAAALALSAQEHLPEAKAQHYQPNFAYILEQLRTRLFTWLLNLCSAEHLLDLLTLFAKTLELKRPGRKAERPKSRINPKPRRAYK